MAKKSLPLNPCHGKGDTPSRSWLDWIADCRALGPAGMERPHHADAHVVQRSARTILKLMEAEGDDAPAVHRAQAALLAAAKPRDLMILLAGEVTR